MNTSTRWRLSLFLLALAGSALCGAADTPASPSLALRVMTFNLRFASVERPNAWPDRRPVMKHTIESAAPDVIGTQEGLYAQLRDIAQDLPAYDWIGVGREGGSRGEHTAIYFRRERFEPVAYDYFWLSSTPEVIGSITWGTAYRRMVTWVRLRERTTGRELYVWNTHFDHQVEEARQKSAALVRDRLREIPRDVPVLLIGDFNCAAGASPAYALLTREAGLADAWLETPTRVNEGLNTFHNYEPPLRKGERIDWILASRPVRVQRTEIVTYHEGTQYPSDHFPVVADVEF